MPGPSVVINIRGDGESAKRALDMVQEKLRETREHAEHESGLIGHAFHRVQETFEALALYDIAREALRGLKELTLGSFEMGESLDKASQKTGLAVETLSVLRYAANVTGSDFDGLTGAVTKMDGTIAAATQGNKKASAFLKSLGLDAKDLAGDADGAEKAFKRFAERLAATENPIRRVELARGLLGKQGAEMIPMLIAVGGHWEEFVEKAKKAGVYLNGAQAAILAETNRKLKEMQQAATGAGIAFSEGLGPGLQQFFDVLSNGKGSMDSFREAGILTARVLDGIAATSYSVASGLNAIVAASELGSLTEGGRKALENMKEYDQKAKEFTRLALAPAGSGSLPADGAPKRKPGGAGGFDGIGDQGSKAKPAKSDDPIVRAAADLVREQATAAADVQKQTTQAMLAELDTQHKLLLVSDTDYYQEKLRLQTVALEAEKTALEKQAAELQALLAKQQGDKLLKRDKQGNSAEELRTQREILQVQERIGEVLAKSQVLGSQHNTEVYTAAQAQELATLRAAAELEKERDSGLSARIALLQRENELQVQKVRNSGAGDAAVDQARQLGEVAVQKLRIVELDKQIRDSEQENRRAVDELSDAASKDPRLKQAAARQISQLNAQEAQQLAALVREYDALAETLGGDFLQKARDLHAELDKLNRPDQRQDAEFTKSLVSGLEGVSTKMIETAGTGRNAFHQMAMSIEKDILNLALKLAEEKWITPLLTGAFGGGGFGGRGPALPQVGTSIPALPQPQGNGNALSTIAQAAGLGSGASQAPKVILNITNATSSPVAASQTGQSYNADLKEFVVHAVLDNAGQGGLLSHLFSGG